MDFLISELTWVIVGVLFVLAELVVPGGIIVFLGLGGFVVAAALFAGLIDTWFDAVTLFFVSSFVLLLLLRMFFMSYFSGDETKANTFELAEDIDQIVRVTATIGPGEIVGQVELRGSLWRAQGDGREISAEGFARVMARENITLMVVPASEDDLVRAEIQGS